VLVIVHFWTRRSGLRLRRRNLIPRKALVGRVAAIGVSSSVWTMSQAVLFALNNHMLESYGGVIYLSAFGVTWRLLMFLGLPVVGIFQGFRPICGYNFGAGNYDRVKKVLGLSFASSAVYLLLPFGAMKFFSRSLIHMFTSDPALLTVGADYMRVFAWLIPTFSATIVGTAFYQSLGMAGRALMMNLLQPLTAVPILLLAGPLWGLEGVIMAFPAAFLLYAALALIIVVQGARRHLDRKNTQSEEPL
jgi:Na+-driven multidrug efflux pump